MSQVRTVAGRQSSGGRPCLLILTVLLLAGLPLPAWSGENGALRPQEWSRELRDLAERSPFGVPLRMQSEEHGGRVIAEMQAIIEHPFDSVKEALGNPASWCEFAPLNVTVKGCTHQRAQDTLLTLYLGRKNYQDPQDASAQPYQFVVRPGQPGTLWVTLNALKGLYGTTEHQLRVELTGVEGRTVLAMHTSYVHSAASKLATVIYLATLGRDKVGFSREETGSAGPPGHVKGLRGMIERNIMRYYLALEAFLDSLAVPAHHRFEARINAAYELMERYPLQLHDLDKVEYLDAKRREYQGQLRLQQKLSVPGSRPADR